MGFRFGLQYARGPYRIDSSVATSAFSAGDLLVKGLGSTISRSPINATSLCALGLPFVGVALSSSTASYDNQVPYIVADNDTEFWSLATTGSTFSEGEIVAFQYTGSRFHAVTGNTDSTGTNRGVIVKGSNVQSWNTDNSTVSYVLVRLTSSSVGSLAYDL